MAPEEMKSGRAAAYARTFSSVTPPEISVSAWLADEIDLYRGLLRRQVVQQQPRRSQFERFFDLGARADFDFDRLTGRLGPFDRLAHASREANMIVLDQHRVVQTHAMIHDAAGRRCHLFEHSQAGRGLAGVENPHSGSRDRSYEFRGERRDAGEPLQKIQGDSFPREQQPRGPAHQRERLIRRCPVAALVAAAAGPRTAR